MHLRDRRMNLRSRIGPALALAGLALLGGGVLPARADIPDVVHNPGTNHYYKWVSGNIDWTNAKSGAQALGGYLVAITSTAEQTWLQSSLVPGGQTAWLGGTDETTEGTWTWLDGEPWAYTNWNSGEPNNVNNEDYLMWNTNGTWNDVYPTYNCQGYVVEWDVNPNIPPPPAAATNLVGVLGPDNHVLLSWTDNSDNESTFELDRKAAATAYARLADVAPNTVAFDDADTFPSATYTYRLRAVNAGGVSAYTNEVTVEIPATVSGPLAPSDLAPVATTATSVTLGWTDNSDDENGFEVLRKNSSGIFQVIANVGADVTAYSNNGLLPDSGYEYRVRSVNGNGASGFVEAAATTSPTFNVITVKADLKDSPKVGKDSLKLLARFEFTPDSDGEFDPVGEGITVRAGTGADPVVIRLPGNVDGWKVTATKATWKSPKGTLPKYLVQVNLVDRSVKVAVKGMNLASPAANPMRTSIGIGDDAGSEHRDWTLKKPGIFQVR